MPRQSPAIAKARCTPSRLAASAAALGKTKIRFFDLREDLAGIPGTYRKLDGHWSQKGEAIVAGRVRRELQSLLGQQ